MTEPSSDTVPAPPAATPSRRGMLGLMNMGNTCYANAALQALRHQSDLAMYILQGKHTELIKRKKSHIPENQGAHELAFTEAFGTLLHELWRQDAPGFIRPEGFWRVMLNSAEKVGFEHFRSRAPHDSQEFMMFVLDMLHEGMKEEVSMTIRETSDRHPLIEESLQTWRRFFEKAYSPLTEILFTLQLNQLTCARCTSVFNRWETNTMLKVSVPSERKSTGDAYDLAELLKQESEGETIEGYDCEKCGKGATVTRKHHLWRLGSWVIVVLKRNDYTGRRINTPVNIPLTQTFTDFFHPISNEASLKKTYQLFGIVNHHGGANGGHYTAQARNPLTGQWNLFDDEAVHALQGPHLDESAYILMYR